MTTTNSSNISNQTSSLGDEIAETLGGAVDGLLDDVKIPDEIKGVADSLTNTVADEVGNIIDDIINPSSDSDGLSPFVICLLSTLGIGAAATATIFGINTNGFSTTPTCCKCSSIDDFPFCDFTKIVPE